MAWYTNALSVYKKKVDTGWRIRKNRTIIGIWEITIFSEVKTKSSFVIISSIIGSNNGKVIEIFDTFQESLEYLTQLNKL